MNQFIGHIENMESKLQDQDAILAEAPEEFVDEMTAELMNDPVMLPASGTILNRSTVEKLLMSKPEDPYNRTPLSIDQVIPRRVWESELMHRA